MPKLVIVAGVAASMVKEQEELARSLDVSFLVTNREDAVWVTRQMNPAAVIVDVAPFPEIDDAVYGLARFSIATSTPVIAVRSDFDDSEPVDAPRFTYICASDGSDHLGRVLAAVLSLPAVMPAVMTPLESALFRL